MHNQGQNPSCMGLLTHIFSKLVHDTKGKELNFHDPSLESGSVSGAGIQRGWMAACPWGAHSLDGEIQFHSFCTHCPVGWGPRFSDSPWLKKINQKSRFFFNMVPYKTTLSSFKCWQPIQIFINHCVGQIKHVWGLNLAQRPPLFNLCSRRRTEFQLVWNESLCGTNRLEFWVSTLRCHVTPPLYSCKSETGLEPWSWKEKKHRRRSSMVGYGGRGVPATWLPSRWGEVWLETDATVMRVSRELWDEVD